MTQEKLNGDIVAYWAERNKHPEYQRGLEDAARWRVNLIDELRAYAYNCAASKDNRAFSKAQRAEMAAGLNVAKGMIQALSQGPSPAVKPEGETPPSNADETKG